MQQVYRHPRKIYELALGLSSSHSPTNVGASAKPATIVKDSIGKVAPASSASQAVPFKSQMTVSDFYKANVLPVLIPLHYCCTPILFYPNWTDVIVTEASLRAGSSSGGSNRTSDGHLGFSGRGNVSGNVPGKVASLTAANESWYYKMRQCVVVEYSKYFESRGFVK